MVVHLDAAANLCSELEDLTRHVNLMHTLDMEKLDSRLKALADAAIAALRRIHSNP